MTPNQPATEAGRALLDKGLPFESWRAGMARDHVASVIRAIEAEAAAAERLHAAFTVEAAIDEAAADLLALRTLLTDVGRWLAAGSAPSGIIADIERVLADTAPAAAEIEARIIAKWADGPEGTRWLNAYLKSYLADWLASPEAAQRLALILESRRPDVSTVQEAWSEARAILAALREQPATDEATA